MTATETKVMDSRRYTHDKCACGKKVSKDRSELLECIRQAIAQNGRYETEEMKVIQILDLWSDEKSKLGVLLFKDKGDWFVDIRTFTNWDDGSTTDDGALIRLCEVPVMLLALKRALIAANENNFGAERSQP